VMNSRRLMGSPLQARSRTLLQRGTRTLLCVTAKLIVEWQRWVILDEDAWHRKPVHVRCTSDCDGIAASQKSAAWCHSTKSLCDSGEMRLVLGINLGTRCG
jgi:hypothetical protein